MTHLSANRAHRHARRDLVRNVSIRLRRADFGLIFGGPLGFSGGGCCAQPCAKPCAQAHFLKRRRTDFSAEPSRSLRVSDRGRSTSKVPSCGHRAVFVWLGSVLFWADLGRTSAISGRVRKVGWPDLFGVRFLGLSGPGGPGRLQKSGGLHPPHF